MKENIYKLLLTLWLVAGLAVAPQKVWACEDKEDSWWEGWTIGDWEDYINSGDARNDGIEGHVWSDADDFYTYADWGVLDDVLESLIGMGFGNEHVAGVMVGILNNNSAYLEDRGIEVGYWTAEGWIDYTDGAKIGEILQGIGWISKTDENGKTWLDREKDEQRQREMLKDSNGDNIPDIIQDLDGDGVLDIFQDTDENGIPDREDPYDDIDEPDNTNSDSSNEYPLPDYPNNATAAENTFDPDTDGTAFFIEKEYDCTGAAQKANEVKQKMMDNPTVKQELDSMRISAKTTNNEVGIAVNYDFDKAAAAEENPYFFNDDPRYNKDRITQGTGRQVSPPLFATAALSGHTHMKYTADSISPTATPPSLEDIFAVIGNAMDVNQMQERAITDMASNPELQNAYRANTDRIFKGELVIAYNGSEYMLYVQDLTAATAFMELHKDVINDTTGKVDKKSLFFQDFDENFRHFRKDKLLTTNEAQTFALAYLLSDCESGVKLLKKEKDSDKFEEQTVRNDTTPEQNKNGEKNLIPIIKKCP